VRFNPQATAADITKFLADNKASIVSGPAGGNGLFKLRVADRQLPSADLTVLAKKMADSPVIGLAVPVR
jgi:hypothetical protein